MDHKVKLGDFQRTIPHPYGPESLETEDNLIRLDSTMAKLLKTVDNQVGLETH